MDEEAKAELQRIRLEIEENARVDSGILKESFTKEIEEVIKATETKIEEFQAIQPPEIEEEEIVEISKFRKFGWLGALLVVGVGAILVAKGRQNGLNVDNSVVAGQGSE